MILSLTLAFVVGVGDCWIVCVFILCDNSLEPLGSGGCVCSVCGDVAIIQGLRVVEWLGKLLRAHGGCLGSRSR